MIERTYKNLDLLIKYIQETKEYYSDGVDEELIQMIKEIQKPLKKFLEGKK